MSTPDAGLTRVLDELRQLERELIEDEYVRREDARERLREAVRRLGEIGSAEGILDHAAEALGTSSRLRRVLISEIRDGQLHPSAIWIDGEPVAATAVLRTLRRAPVALEYPLIEEEVARHQRLEQVTVAAARSRTPAPLTAALGWSTYIVAAVVVDAATVGLLHADAGERPLDGLDRELVARFCDGLAGVFERAVLRETLRRHRSELQSAVRWMSGRLSRLAAETAGDIPAPAGAHRHARAVETLTRREVEVVRLMARGQTNGAIANALLVREGTVKYHAKNVLRKLGATSRADAVARYVRGTGGSGAVGNGR